MASRPLLVLAAACAAATLAPAGAAAAPGQLDPAFGDRGRVDVDNILSGLGEDGTGLTRVRVLPDGRIVVLGSQRFCMGCFSQVVARYLPDGTPDPSFGAGGSGVRGFLGTDDYGDGSAGNGLVVRRDGGLVLGFDRGPGPRISSVAPTGGAPPVDTALEAGVQARDLCGGAIGAGKLAGGTATAEAAANLAAPSLPDPRPVRVAPAGKEGGAVRLVAAQLRINQRIYQAAIRRADALEDRLAGKLTGSDLAAGALTQDKLHPRLRILSATPAEFEPARSRTQVAAGRSGKGEIALTAGQLHINQRIAQAAVRRANALVARLEAGLTGDAFADGSITARNLASGVVKP